MTLTLDATRRQRAREAADHTMPANLLAPEAVTILVDAILRAYLEPTDHEAALIADRRKVRKVATDKTVVTPDQDPADNPQSGESWERDDVPSRTMAPPGQHPKD